MTRKNFNSDREETENTVAGDWFLVVRDDGVMHCSCGRPLIKLDDGTYKCKAGYPQYRPDQGEIIIDKFGNLMMRVKPHQ